MTTFVTYQLAPDHATYGNDAARWIVTSADLEHEVSGPMCRKDAERHAALLNAAEVAINRLAWVIDLVSAAVGHLNPDNTPSDTIELLDEVTSSEYLQDDLQQVQSAFAEAIGRAA